MSIAPACASHPHARVHRVHTLGAALFVTLGACAAAGDDGTQGAALPGSGGAPGAVGDAGSAEAGSPGAGGGPPSNPAALFDGGTTTIPATCGGDRYDAEARQLDIYVMMDESGSMIPWWPFVVPAIGQFLDSPAAAGIGVGIQTFGESCNAGDYAVPKVPIAPLPGNAAALKAAIPLFPLAGTPTRPALEGAIQHARAWAMSHPESKIVVLLVTDGLPDECDSSVDNVAQVARMGFEASPSIPTYVIGLPLLEPLNPIAQAGGTQTAIAADPSNTQALVDAMNKVRGVALPCDYKLPANTQDKSLVNLDYRPAQGAAQRIPQRPNPAACGPEGGWYYDPANPDRIVACDSTCQQFKGGNGQVDVVLGCPTVTLL